MNGKDNIQVDIKDIKVVEQVVAGEPPVTILCEVVVRRNGRLLSLGTMTLPYTTVTGATTIADIIRKSLLSKEGKANAI